MRKRPGMKNTDRSFLRHAVPVVLGLFLLAASCTIITPAPPSPADAALPRITLDEAISLRDILDGVDTLRGTVRITMDLGGEAAPQSIAGYLAIRTPDAARFTYIGPFGIVLFEAVANGDVLTLYLPRQMTAYTGSQNEDGGAEGSIGAADMPFSDLFGAFTLDESDLIFFLEHREVETILYGISPVTDESGTSWGIVEKVVIDRETMRPVTRERFVDGTVVSRTTYGEFQEINGIVIPKTITIADLVSGQTITVTLSNVTANESLAEEVFETTPGDPWTVMPLDQFIPPTF